jgi:hypothetical protein
MTQLYGDAENLESLRMLWQMDADGHLEPPTEEPSNFDGPDWRREKLDSVAAHFLEAVNC